ncbi:hypothetical protein NBRC110019_03450 [Neptunitalea chrysea]|uniref:Starch-binding associating with outer membrane n=1 Tax=Neptunitalea chrysea TaxID=1647581 RepID=A0A9W6EU63_9FLAO|nr:SusD/RagB family nutrient-binding outer membrane lipoprotein [Neptunitalea chrysea]GLB51306.1 hypothetical protein NBRC110019_03450 [Neptunitalea chrysea]
MKHSYKFLRNLLSLVMVVSIAGCKDDFTEINTNPNDPTSATPELLVPGVIRSIANDWADYGWGTGALVMQHSARYQFTDDDRYIWDPSGDPYSTGYDALRDVNNILEASQDSELMAGYYGVGLILKSWIMSIITDAYGDAPYSEATLGQITGNFTPVFDSQSDIYTGILADLENANDILANASNIDGDILYGGDVSLWRKFANSLRLRLLMRLTDVSNSSSIAAIQTIVSNPTQYPIFESNEDMAAVTWNTGNPQPKYETRSGSFDELRLSQTLETRLKALNDTRLVVFAQPISNANEGWYSDNWDYYVGEPNGLSDEDALAYNGGSNNISRIGILFACDACDDDASATAAQTIIMSYSEVQFILAEARQRDFISTGDVETYYETGIKASFEYYKSRIEVGGWSQISDLLDGTLSDMDTYLTQGGVALTGTSDEILNKIYLQKWISLYNTGFEAWSDWRRTGQPEVVPGPAASNNSQVPVRFLYPSSVKSTNNANYQSAVQNQGADDINTRLWWDVSSNN